ncbi:hypothetical protein LTR10_021005 [Elasticomyces elasticus]|uniref:Uncharacterized protein n=1 Tax=Exophiala sideris TaxID=1016849 RepID=A0ABR0JLY6_9EURO|nr:hypothetical protein LTR10_021005 [Elasticomyces elasticus]KAK5036514.1 hypothetical protein LTS07_002241 [Exophiala sideris]KAK5041657.1 hypothetical protein LTR13_002324 [Exophiala sideris]KAK5066897.1 hypothetical protein LTR69_002245 [Exophiala sideris]KAK5184956.1 hypothetical protein LTR44_002802 [Eurotiomycetes sp. CCFEE 6388]
MPSSRVPPEVSPTTSSFLSATGPTTASVRRNLFSGHLSRRPVSRPGSQDEAQMPPSVAQPPPPPSRRIHQRSVSTPSLSPSPPRLTPSNNYQLGNGAPPVFAHPLLQPTQSPPRNSFLDTYDPTVSPNRPLSPGSTATLFPNSSIIAVNPLTGKPVLPHLPVLPGRLKLTDSDDEGLEIIEPGQPREARAGDGHPSRYDSYSHSPSADADYAHQAAMAAAAAEAEAEAEADEERRARERIERMLKDMMARQRAKVKNKSPASNIPAPHHHSRISRRAQAQAQNQMRTRVRHEPTPDMDADEIDPAGYHVEFGDEENHSPIYTGPDIDAESDAEKEELMGLITASLRREVARADEEAWMFGGFDGVGVGGELGFD